MGADPVACAALAGGAQVKAFFVRKDSKAHGLQRRIEGPPLLPEDRCVVVEEGWQQSGVGAEVAARVMEHAFDYLDAPVARVSGKDVPMPYAANLEKLALPSVAEVVAAAKSVCYR